MLRSGNWAALALICGLVGIVVAKQNCPHGNGVATYESIAGSNRMIKATGCPEYSPYDQTTPNTPIYQNINVKVPVQPTLCTQPQWYNDPTQSLYSIGVIGLVLNGVPLYDAADAQKRNAYEYEGASMDACLGHASPQGYHYHTGSTCEYSDPAGSHSTMYAIMADGFPLYGPNGIDGTEPNDLDICRGHSSDLGYYHYHMQPTLTTWPFTVNCLMGDLSSSTLMARKPAGRSCTHATIYDLANLAIPWVANASPSSDDSTPSPPPSNDLTPNPRPGPGPDNRPRPGPIDDNTSSPPIDTNGPTPNPRPGPGPDNRPRPGPNGDRDAEPVPAPSPTSTTESTPTPSPTPVPNPKPNPDSNPSSNRPPQQLPSPKAPRPQPKQGRRRMF